MTTEDRPITSAPARPVQAEALGADEIAVAWNGDTYIIPTVDDWPIEAVEAMESGKGVQLLKLILGTKQWNRFRKEHGKKRDIDALAEAIAEAGGFESAGN